MDNESFEHRKNIFKEYEQFFNLEQSVLKFEKGSSSELLLNSAVDLDMVRQETCQTMFINSKIKNTSLKSNGLNLVMNCMIQSSEIEIGKNSVLTDLNWVFFDNFSL